jgi:hypothetical protein
LYIKKIKIGLLRKEHNSYRRFFIEKEDKMKTKIKYIFRGKTTENDVSNCIYEIIPVKLNI